MSKKEKSKNGAILLALVLIVNPNINIVDILPDFVGYIILIRAISGAALTTPYFSEAKTYLTRLMWLSVLRVPAFLIITAVRNQNASDGDIIVLMTLVFAVCEVLLLIFAISNLFSGIFYMGERCDTPSLISKFKIGAKRTSSVETLRNTAYCYAVVKTALNFLPELLRLTKTVEIGSTEYVSYLSAFYPFALIGALAVSLVIGIFFAKYANKYVLFTKNDFENAVCTMYGYNTDDVDKRSRIFTLQRATTILMIASVFSLEVIFDNFHGINILPHSVYGIFMSVGIYLFIKECSYKSKALALTSSAVGIGYSAVALLALIASISFLSEYTYQDLLLGDVVMAKYLPIIIFSAAELLLLLVLLSLGAVINRRFVLENTGISRDNPAYNSADRDFHKSLTIRGYILYALAALSGISKFVQVMLNFNVQIIFTNQSEAESTPIITTPLPWWGMIVFALTAAYIIYSFIYFSTLKDEVEYKLQK